jgi:hypothetical protein
MRLWIVQLAIVLTVSGSVVGGDIWLKKQKRIEFTEALRTNNMALISAYERLLDDPKTENEFPYKGVGLLFKEVIKSPAGEESRSALRRIQKRLKGRFCNRPRAYAPLMSKFDVREQRQSRKKKLGYTKTTTAYAAMLSHFKVRVTNLISTVDNSAPPSMVNSLSIQQSDEQPVEKNSTVDKRDVSEHMTLKFILNQDNK